MVNLAPHTYWNLSAASGGIGRVVQQGDPTMLSNLGTDPELQRFGSLATMESALCVPLHAGLLSRREVHAEIGEIVAGLKPGRQGEEEITVFCSTGLAVQDCVTAKLVYDAAIKKKVGRYMQILP